MEDETETVSRPECPFCRNNSGQCEHVILDFDASFMDLYSGYLLDDSEETEELKSELLKLLKSGIKPEISDDLIESIWQYAFDNFDEDSEEIEFDMTAYCNYLDRYIDDFDAETFHYGDEDGLPGNSSVYVIIYSKDPRSTVKKINNQIISKIIK